MFRKPRLPYLPSPRRGRSSPFGCSPWFDSLVRCFGVRLQRFSVVRFPCFMIRGPAWVGHLKTIWLIIFGPDVQGSSVEKTGPTESDGLPKQIVGLGRRALRPRPAGFGSSARLSCMGLLNSLFSSSGSGDFAARISNGKPGQACPPVSCEICERANTPEMEEAARLLSRAAKSPPLPREEKNRERSLTQLRCTKTTFCRYRGDRVAPSRPPPRPDQQAAAARGPPPAPKDA